LSIAEVAVSGASDGGGGGSVPRRSGAAGPGASRQWLQAWGRGGGREAAAEPYKLREKEERRKEKENE
jgi:hypothetical protein